MTNTSMEQLLIPKILSALGDSTDGDYSIQ